MSKEPLEEQVALRKEILARACMLHQMLSLAVVLVALLIPVGVWLRSQLDQTTFNWFILLIPIIFSLLSFNYQANQMTLEAVSGFYNRKGESGWEKYYGEHKLGFQLTSFLKVLPLLLPLLLPFFLQPTDSWLITLKWFDVILFGLVLFNFRYKMIYHR